MTLQGPDVVSAAADALTPRLATVVSRVQETDEVATITLEGAGLGPVAPGRFAMLTAFGVGEAAISMSGDPADAARLVHTIHAVGPVSAALCGLAPGARVGVRGPYGRPWPVAEARGRDLLLVASGIGLAPLRPAVLHALARRGDYGRVIVLYGARTPETMLFAEEFARWRDGGAIEATVTMSRAGREWRGEVGYVTGLLPRIGLDPARTAAMVCGPEPMIRSTAVALEGLGVDPARIAVSLERNMKCAVGWCGRCQLGPLILCRDGPVFGWDRVRDAMRVREL